MTSNLPPGCPGPHTEEVPHHCDNEECDEYLKVVNVSMHWELGGYFYIDEDNDPVCENCGDDLEGI